MTNTNTNSNISPADLVEIQKSYVDRVHAYLKMSTTAWLNIANVIAVAKNKLKPLAYQRFITDCGFTTAVADKLVSVGRCDILRDEKYLPVLASADGWTVVSTELSKLAPQKISSLLELVANGNEKKLTREMIYNVSQTINPLDQKRVIVVSIEIDDSKKLKSLSAEQFSEMQLSINALQKQIDDIHAGFIVKPRKNNIVMIRERAQANSNAMIVRTAA